MYRTNFIHILLPFFPEGLKILITNEDGEDTNVTSIVYEEVFRNV